MHSGLSSSSAPDRPRNNMANSVFLLLRPHDEKIPATTANLTDLHGPPVFLRPLVIGCPRVRLHLHEVEVGHDALHIPVQKQC